MPITESSITLNFPDDNYFRFEDCEGYKKIQHNFREMDACWYDESNDILYIIELKNWESNSLEEENDPTISSEEIEKTKTAISKSRIHNLLKKSIDSVCMFMSILLEKPYGNVIQNCSPFTITSHTKIKLLSIINWTDTDSSYVANINSAYRSKFKSYARLFEIKTFLVLTKDKAIERFDWIS